MKSDVTSRIGAEIHGIRQYIRKNMPNREGGGRRRVKKMTTYRNNNFGSID